MGRVLVRAYAILGFLDVLLVGILLARGAFYFGGQVAARVQAFLKKHSPHEQGRIEIRT